MPSKEIWKYKLNYLTKCFEGYVLTIKGSETKWKIYAINQGSFLNDSLLKRFWSHKSSNLNNIA